MTEQADLTTREMQVLQLLSMGLDGHQIAAELGLQFSSVAKIRLGLYPKLGATNAAHAVSLGYQRGFLTVGEDSTGAGDARVLATALRHAGYRLTRTHGSAR